MAGGDNKEVFGIDLDTKEFVNKAKEAGSLIAEIGEGDFSGLIANLMNVAGQFALVGAAALLVKATFDAVFEAERIKKIDATFENLAHNSGIMASELKEGLVKAGGGMVETTELLQAANKAMVTLGGNAAKLPEILELARKSAKIFGGDVIERFEQISFAISTGNQRMLKHNGIIVDVTKAEKDYAASLGVLPAELNEAGKRQAILNAALGDGSKNLKDIKGSTESATATLVMMKVALRETSEAIKLAFEKVAGPAVRQFMSAWANAASMLKSKVFAEFGEGAEQAEAKVNNLKNKLYLMASEIQKMEAKKNKMPSFFESLFGNKEDRNKELFELKTKYAELQKEIELAEEKHHEIVVEKHEKEKEEVKVVEEKGFVNTEAVQKRKLKLSEELLKMRLEHNKIELDDSTTTAEASELVDERKALMEQERIQKIAEQKREFKDKGITDEEEQKERLLMINEKYDSEIRNLERQRADYEVKALENQQRQATNTFDGIAKASETTARKAQKDLQDFGARGAQVLSIFQKRGSQAFQQFGESLINHSKSASEILKGFMLNALADIAQAQGELYLAMGLMDPAAAAAGAGLLVLSGVLRALAGSAGGGSMGGGGGGGGAAGGTTSTADQMQQPQQQKAVTLQVMGNYFETEQTKTKLVDMIREATDATSFSYVQIGQKGP